MEEQIKILIEQMRSMEVRMRKVEDFILGTVNTLLELSQDLKSRVLILEGHDAEFMAMVNTTCDIKNKEIAEARKDAIEISTTYTDKQHNQTWIAVSFIITTIIGLVVYFNIENTNRALDIKKHETQIDTMAKTLDKIDGKLDKLNEHIGGHK